MNLESFYTIDKDGRLEDYAALPSDLAESRITTPLPHFVCGGKIYKSCYNLFNEIEGASSISLACVNLPNKAEALCVANSGDYFLAITTKGLFFSGEKNSAHLVGSAKHNSLYFCRDEIGGCLCEDTSELTLFYFDSGDIEQAHMSVGFVPKSTILGVAWAAKLMGGVFYVLYLGDQWTTGVYYMEGSIPGRFHFTKKIEKYGEPNYMTETHLHVKGGIVKPVSILSKTRMFASMSIKCSCPKSARK